MTVNPKKLGYDEQPMAPTPEQFARMQNNQTVEQAYNSGQRDSATVGSYREQQLTPAMQAARQTNASGSGYVAPSGGSTEYAKSLGYFPENKVTPTQGEPTLSAVTPATETPTVDQVAGGAPASTPTTATETTAPVQGSNTTDLFGLPQDDNLTGGFARSLDVGKKVAQAGQANIQGDFAAAEEARKKMLIQNLNQTNVADAMASRGAQLRDLSVQELEDLAVAQGLDLSEDVRDRIKAQGAPAIEAYQLERDDRLAENKYAERKVEREYGRALSEREKFNAQQDVRLRKLLGAFGGGQVDTMSGNTSVMNALEEGQRAKEDLVAQFADTQGLYQRQADSIIKQYTNNVAQVNAQVEGMLEAKRQEIMDKDAELIEAGVTNQSERNKALYANMSEYAKLYSDIMTLYDSYVQEQNQWMVEQQQKLQDQQFEQDKYMTDTFGVLYQGGQPVVDQDGTPLPTLSALREQNEQDYKASMLSGVLYRNGAPVLDKNGNTFSTFDAQKFEQSMAMDYAKMEQDRVLQQAKMSQDAQQFEVNTGIKLSEQEFEQVKFQASLAEKGIEYGTTVDLSPTNSFRPQNSKYAVTASGGGLVVNAPIEQTDDGKEKLAGARRQCGMYANDVIGIPSYFGDSFESKKSRVTTQAPSPGAAFVLETAMPHGHVGIVEKVNPDGSIVISESNYDGKEHFRRITTTLESLQSRGLVGFTEGLKTSVGFSKNEAQTKEQKQYQAEAESYAKRLMSAESVMQEIAPGIESAASDARMQLDWNPFSGFGLLKAAQGGWTTGRDLPSSLQGAEIQRQRQAETDFLTAVLRKESGGAITDQEFELWAPKYFPMPGDTQEVIEQKRKTRQQEVDNFLTEAGYNTKK